MTENLFKLKKDGKTVGYLKIDRGLICWRNTNLSTVLSKTWYTVHNSARIDFDTVHPFVTKDKNGKDVFEGDKATAIVWMEDLANHRIKGEIIYQNCGYCINTPNTYYHLNDLKDIELIED